jgi:hypothetical protein
MGEEGGSVFSLRDPIGKVILTDRPTLAWRPLPDATRYHLTLFDITDGRQNVRIVASTPVAGTKNAWQPARPLARGRTYEWEVRAVKEDREEFAPPGRFRVLDQRAVEQIARHGDALLAVAALYAREGLLDEAEQTLQLLLTARPAFPAARSLMQRVRAARPPDR